MRRSIVVVLLAMGGLLGLPAGSQAASKPTTLVDAGAKWDTTDFTVSQNGKWATYVRLPNDSADTDTQTVLLTNLSSKKSVQVTPAIPMGDVEFWAAAASNDGSTVYYESDDPGLVPSVRDHGWHLYRYDVASKTTTVISAPGASTPFTTGSNICVAPDANGGLVAFSASGQIAPGDKNSKHDVYLYKASTGAITLVSHLKGSKKAGGLVQSTVCPVITPNGRYVAFASAARLAKNDHDSHADVYRYDTKTGANRLVSSERSTLPAGYAIGMSPNGQHIAYFALHTHGSKETAYVDADVYEASGKALKPHLVLRSTPAEPTGWCAIDCIAVSSTGRYIAMQHDVTATQYECSSGCESTEVIRFDSKTRKQVTVSSPVQFAFLVWMSASGHKIDYWETHWSRTGGGDGSQPLREWK